MELVNAIKTRKSIRDFKTDPVPRKVIKEILTTAVLAPSGVNRQPWEFAVITGHLLDKIKEANVQRLYSSGSSLGKTSTLPPDSPYLKRQVDLARELFRLMDIEREDKEKRRIWMERGFRYFNAPAVIILLSDKSLPAEQVQLEIGGLMQTICLMALEYDLGTCIEGQGVAFPEILYEMLEIPEKKRIIMAIAIGYPNWDFPANNIETPREAVENITLWEGFKENTS
ncbi:MAG: nitroreductase [Desulfobacterales bacterium]|nr:nitroreductase [Desulfobacteraceae bacterium]MBT7085067.1 nitroreductase [Desulfobacterales bacterium]MBT7696200.1 nitroreductase [Desulfobacterales bacterium]